MKMVLKVKKEASDFPKAKVKAKALKVKKVVLESVHSQKKKKNLHITCIPVAQDTACPKVAQTPLKEHPQEKQVGPLCHQLPSDY